MSKHTVSWTVTVFDQRALRRAATARFMGEWSYSRQEWAERRRRQGTVGACLEVLVCPTPDCLGAGFEIEDSSVY